MELISASGRLLAANIRADHQLFHTVEMETDFLTANRSKKLSAVISNPPGISGTFIAKLLIEQAVAQLRATSSALAILKKEMQELASTLPEYTVVTEMFGVGPTLDPQLMAEIGDIHRFHSQKALVAFAGLDPPPNDSGQISNNHRRITKRGSPALRRALFLILGVILQNSPADEPVYQFMDKK